MKTMKEIVEDIKDIISIELKTQKNKKTVLDKDVAYALNIEPNLLALAKARSKVLYKEVIEFCASRKICVNTLLFSQNVKSLEPNTDQYLMKKYYIAC